jgi:opacity protein-like surface antigen
LKKFTVLAVMLALVLTAAIPAVAQVVQEVGQETESAGVAAEFSVASEGNFASQCAAPLQFGNTANLQNTQSFLQYDSVADDLVGGGSVFGFAPAIETACEQAVQQSAAASS